MFSIIVTAHKDPHRLRRCLHSIDLYKTSLVEEIVVVIDSEDAGFKDQVFVLNPNIKLIFLHKNRGFATAHNVGAANAFGEYLIFLDDDQEVVHPDWIKSYSDQIIGLEAEGVGVSYHFGTRLAPDEEERELHIFIKKLMAQSSIHAQPKDHVLHALQTGGLCIRRESFEALAGYDEKLHLDATTVEFDFGVRFFAKKPKVGDIKGDGHLYVHHVDPENANIPEGMKAQHNLGELVSHWQREDSLFYNHNILEANNV